MKRFTMMLAMLLIGGALNGCTNYVYQGSIKAEDSEGKQRQMLLYWSKTEPLIGDEKADIAHLNTECGSLIVFENQPEGIIFRGEPQRDRIVPELATPDAGTSKTFECGRITGASRLTELGSGKVSLTIRCAPLSDDFSVVRRVYPKARQAAYVFDVTENKNWSLLGSTPELPAPPPCRE